MAALGAGNTVAAAGLPHCNGSSIPESGAASQVARSGYISTGSRTSFRQAFVPPLKRS